MGQCLNQIIVLQKRLRRLLRRRKILCPIKGACSTLLPCPVRAGGGVITYARDGPEGKWSRDLESDELEQLRGPAPKKRPMISG